RASVRCQAASSGTISSPSGSPPARMAASASLTGIRAKSKAPRLPKLLNAECGKRSRHVVGRSDVNGGEAICPRARDIVRGIVEEHNAGGGRPDRAHDVMIGRFFRLSEPDAGGEIYFPEMAEHVGVGLREMRDMRPVGVGEGIERHLRRGARQQW